MEINPDNLDFHCKCGEVLPFDKPVAHRCRGCGERYWFIGVFDGDELDPIDEKENNDRTRDSGLNGNCR